MSRKISEEFSHHLIRNREKGIKKLYMNYITLHKYVYAIAI